MMHGEIILSKGLPSIRENVEKDLEHGLMQARQERAATLLFKSR